MKFIKSTFPKLVPSIFLLIILSFKFSYSQDNVLKFEHITTNNGLPHNTVYGISRDKYGFVWFSTFSGLARYDGYKMTFYRTKGNDSKSLINNRVKCLVKDGDGDLWISFFDTNVLCRYNYEQDDFTRFNPGNVPAAIADSLNKMYTSPMLVVGNNDYKWYIKRWQDDPRNLELFQENKHTGEKIIYYHNPLNPYSLNDEFNNTIYLDEQGILWIGAYMGGVNKTDTYSKNFQHYYHVEGNPNTLVDNIVRTICDDKEGNIWVGTFSKGITCFNRKKHTYFHLKKDYSSSNSLLTNSIRKIYLDHKGILWIGTKEGLGRYDTKLKQFRQYTYEKKQIPNNWIFSILEDSLKNLWIGTFRGIARYNARLDKFISYDSTIVPNNLRIRSMILDSKNNIWAGTEGNGVFKFQVSKDGSLTSEKIAYSSSNFNLNRIYSLLEDSKGNFWFGTAGGLQKYDTKKHIIKEYNLKDSLNDKTIVGILRGSKDEIWVSYTQGLTKLNPMNDSIVNYSPIDGIQGNAFSFDAYYKSPYTNELFFGGANGLNIFYPDSIKNNPYLPKIVFTELKIKNKTVKLGDKVNGRVILSKPLYLTPEISLKRSDVIFSVEFAAMHFSNPQTNKYRYRLKGFDKEWIYTNATNRTATYSNLWPGSYVLEVYASNNDGMWTKAPTQLRIVILRAWWQEWWFIVTSVIAFFTLIYVAYLLRVSFYRKQHEYLNTLVKNRTIELEEKNQLLIDRQSHIERQTEELRLNSENLVLANLQLLENQTIIQKQAKKLQETNDELSTLNLTKDRFFSILAHDLRNPFNTVSGFSELLLRNLDRYTPEKIRHFIDVIYKTSHNTYLLLNNLLDWSRSQSGQMQFNPINNNLLIILEETLGLLSSQATQKNIEISQEVEPDIFVFADENMLKTIFRNLISNAIKFTNQGGRVTIKAFQKDKMVEIEVIDTGIGISSEKIDILFRIDVNFHVKGTNNENGTGLGLILCKEFIEKNGGKIWVNSVIDKGSTFTFTLKSA